MFSSILSMFTSLNLKFIMILTHGVEGTHKIVDKVADKFDMGAMIAHHLSDAPLWKLEAYGYDISITKRVVMMWITSLLLLLIFIPIARKIKKSPYKKPNRLQGFFEVLIQFVRKDISQSSMGHHSKHYEPYLLTVFFFVLAGNLLGLFPSLGEIAQTVGEVTGLLHAPHSHDSLLTPMLMKLWPGGAFTGDIAVTATMASLTLLMILIAGFAHQGVGYIKNIVPKGIAAPLWLIMWPIELIGHLTKPFALAIRLLANMTAGHLIILVLTGFIFQFQSYGVAAISVPAAMAIYFLELFVAFLQAYIFTFLTALFVAGAQHRH